MANDCPKCKSPNAAHRRVCAECGEQLKGDVVNVNRCDLCRHPNPVERMAHWMRVHPDDIEKHLIENLRLAKADAVGRKQEIRQTVARHTHRFADEFGAWLEPAEAYVQRMRDAQRDKDQPFEEFHTRHVREHQLVRGKGETAHAFARRCLAAANLSAGTGPLARRLNFSASAVREPGCDDDIGEHKTLEEFEHG